MDPTDAPFNHRRTGEDVAKELSAILRSLLGPNLHPCPAPDADDDIQVAWWLDEACDYDGELAKFNAALPLADEAVAVFEEEGRLLAFEVARIEKDIQTALHMEVLRAAGGDPTQLIPDLLTPLSRQLPGVKRELADNQLDVEHFKEQAARLRRNVAGCSAQAATCAERRREFAQSGKPRAWVARIVWLTRGPPKDVQAAIDMAREGGLLSAIPELERKLVEVTALVESMRAAHAAQQAQ